MIRFTVFDELAPELISFIESGCSLFPFFGLVLFLIRDLDGVFIRILNRNNLVYIKKILSIIFERRDLKALNTEVSVTSST